MLSKDEIKRCRLYAESALASQRLEGLEPSPKVVGKWIVLLLESLK
ncbi:antitoxin VbhA family protein [Bartonella heixiaziensis]